MLWNAWSFDDPCCKMQKVNIIPIMTFYEAQLCQEIAPSKTIPKTIHQTILMFPFCQTSPFQNRHDFAFAATPSACLCWWSVVPVLVLVMLVVLVLFMVVLMLVLLSMVLALVLLLVVLVLLSVLRLPVRRHWWCWSGAWCCCWWCGRCWCWCW